MISTRSALAWLAPSTGSITGKTRFAIFGACLAAIVGLVASMAGAANATTGNPCTFTTSGKTMTLNADCTTDSTITLQNGVTLNGNGHTITVSDPSSGAFNGAVVTNANGATVMYVKNLRINGASTAVDQCDRVYNGVAFTNASGSVTNVTLTGIGLPETGCQIGRAILVDDTQSGLSKQSVEISGNTISSYNKNGIDVRGNVNAAILRNTVTGTATSAIIRNGLVVRDGASAQVSGNTISGNQYDSQSSCGILVLYGATVTMDKKNTVTGNDVPFYADSGSTIGGRYYSA